MSYWDTSALVKLYAKEPDSAVFENYLVSVTGPVAMSRISLYETARFLALPGLSMAARCKFVLRKSPGAVLERKRPRTCSIRPRGGRRTCQANARSSRQETVRR